MKYNKKIIYIIATCTICLCLILFSGCNFLTCSSCNTENSPTARNATNNDIYISDSLLAVTSTFKIKPNEDINNLTLQFKFYDENNKVLETHSENVGNVTKGNEFTVSVRLNNFNIFNLYTIKSYSVNVISGTVSVFA